eukprot:Gb_04073 [translate_table: standard]
MAGKGHGRRAGTPCSNSTRSACKPRLEDIVMDLSTGDHEFMKHRMVYLPEISDPKEGMSVPIGIILAGSDNSLAWNTDTLRAGLTVAYYGFLIDVLELSGKCQNCFGPLRYFEARALKFLSLPKHNCEFEYLPISGPASGTGMESKGTRDQEGRKLNNEGLPRPASLSSIDSILTTPSQISGEVDTMVADIDASSGLFDYVRKQRCHRLSYISIQWMKCKVKKGSRCHSLATRGHGGVVYVTSMQNIEDACQVFDKMIERNIEDNVAGRMENNETCSKRENY